MGETFCLIKPEAFDRREDIEKDIIGNNFSILEKMESYWKWNQMREMYSKENLHYNTKTIKKTNRIMSFLIPYEISRKFPNPMVEALILSSDGDTIRDFVKFCGPTAAMEYTKKEFKNTLRGKYGLGPEHGFIRTIEGKEYRFDFNGIHKSSTKKEFIRDRKIYF
jgi:hypothetical protein